MNQTLVGIIMGSDSDLPVMRVAMETLSQFGVGYEVKVLSAHRTSQRTIDYALGAESRGMKVIIAGAGGAAHLAGLIAAQTTLPVIGVPLEATPLQGWDALLSTVQMPAGVPVATVAVGKAGARNAALLAVQILSLQEPSLREKLREFRRDLARQIEEKSWEVEKEFPPSSQ